MMTSVDGRIDCPMVGQLSTDEYYIALEKLGPCSKLSGRITTALECSAVKEESTPMEGTPIGHKSVLPQAMELLHEHFGVERLAIVGGGHICGGFLEAGLIDEVSIMVAPGIDGRKGQTAVFDGISRMECNPYKLKLESVEQWETDIVWLRYKVK